MKKKMSFTNYILLAIVGLLIFSNEAQAIPISGLYNTGVDDVGSVLPIGSSEMHYTLSRLASDAKVISPHPFWLTAPSGSSWIGPSNGDITDPVGDFLYTLNFDLTSLDPTTAIITGEWAYDNLAVLSLNGVATPFSNPTQFFSLASFTLDSGFISGVNTLEFQVTNNPGVGTNPTSLLVTNLSGQASAVPEPSTYLLLGSGLAGLALYRRKQNQKN